MKIAICFLTVRPTKEFFQSLNILFTIKLYDIYIVIDDNQYTYDDNINNSLDYNIIKIDNRECENAGFKNSVFYFKNKSCSRDKALFYFRNTDYDHIWFIEEDVLIPHINTLTSIDNQYHSSDLICQKFNKSDSNWTLFGYVNSICNKKIDPPYYNCMICAVRLSKKMLNIIFNFATKFQTLFLDESMFPTLAIQNNLKIEELDELNTLAYHYNWQLREIDIKHFYHPMKEDDKRLNLIKIFSLNNYKQIIKISNNIFNKTYSWGESYHTLTFFDTFELNCVGTRGYLYALDSHLFGIYFNGYDHILKFNEDYTEFISNRLEDDDIIKGKLILKPINELIFKKYSWGNNNIYTIKFLENGEMDAFGKGNYDLSEPQVVQANFGNESHVLTFNEDYTEFTSIREKDGEFIQGKLI